MNFLQTVASASWDKGELISLWVQKVEGQDHMVAHG